MIEVTCAVGVLGRTPYAPPEEEARWREVRQQRNALLDEWRWAILPDSPLSDECQAAFGDYLAALHRVTLDHDQPDAVTWPDPPALTYR